MNYYTAVLSWLSTDHASDELRTAVLSTQDHATDELRSAVLPGRSRH